MRLFYASFLSPESIRVYDELVAGWIAGHLGSLRAVPPGSQHLTLAFLGDLPDSELPAAREILNDLASEPSFPFSLGTPRVLRGRGGPRLICADLTCGKERVVQLQDLLARELAERMPERGIRPKPPHVTLARFARGADREAVRGVERELSRIGFPARDDRIAAIHLVRSTLTPQGPIYRSVGRADLAN